MKIRDLFVVYAASDFHKYSTFLARVLFLTLVALLVVAFARGNTATVCVGDVCRDVEVGPIERDFKHSVAEPRRRGFFGYMVDHRRFLLMEGTAAGAALLHQTGMRHCRSVSSVENCDLGYGDANAFFWIATSFSTVVFPAIAEDCWKHTDDWKGCYPIGYAGAAYQAIVGARDWSVGKSPVLR